MRRLEFQAHGLGERDARRLKRAMRVSGPAVPKVRLLRQCLIAAALLAVAYSVNPIGIYIFNRPGRIEMTASIDPGGVTINGKVEDPRASVVPVSTNGVNSSEPVVGGSFSLQIPASQTPTVIKASAGGTTAVLTVPPQSAQIELTQP